MFFVTGDYSVTFITADQLRIELKAGGLNQKQEDHVIGHILQSSETGEVGDWVRSSVGKTMVAVHLTRIIIRALQNTDSKKNAITLQYLFLC